MKNFITVFNFTYFQNLKSKFFIIITIIGIIATCAAVNINTIKKAFSSNSNQIVAFYDENDKLNLDMNKVKKYLPDNYDYEILKSKTKVKTVKQKIKNEDSKYFGLITIGEKNTDNVNLYVKYVIDSKPVDEINNYIQGLYFKYKAKKLQLSTLEYSYLRQNIPFNIVEQNKKARNNQFLIYILIIVLYAVILYYGTIAANSIIGEKSNRIMETLITAAKPIELFLGKIIGVCALGLSQLLVFILSGYIALKVSKTKLSLVAGVNIKITGNMLVYFVIFAVMGFLLYSLIYGAMGSLVSNTQEATQAMLPMTLIIFVVFFIGLASLENPNSMMTKVFSYIPFSSPIIMFERIGLTSVKFYEIVISIIILAFSIVGVGVLSSKVYKRGVVHYGKKMSVFKALK